VVLEGEQGFVDVPLSRVGMQEDPEDEDEEEEEEGEDEEEEEEEGEEGEGEGEGQDAMEEDGAQGKHQGWVVQ